MPEMADSYNFALAVNDQLTNGGQTPMYSATKLQQILDFQAGKAHNICGRPMREDGIHSMIPNGKT